MNVIEVNKLSVQYRGVEALSRISFDVEEGDYIGIVGPNGSGKTTLIKALLGLIPYEGKILFQGKSLEQFTHSKKHIGYLPQKMSFIDEMFPAKAIEIVASGVYCCKKFPKRLTGEDYKAALKAMDILGIKNLKDRPVGKLSGGQQQRVLLSRALIHQPDVLILDEPTVALDPQARDTFYATIEELNKENKTTILFVSHDIGSAGNFVSKLLYLDRKIVFFGTLDDFCKSPQMSDYFGHDQHLICHRH